MSLFTEKLINLICRGLSVLGRFLLILYIGKYFAVELLGDYGIFFTTITLSVLLIGYDFYTYTNRELLKVNHQRQGTMLFNQLIAHAIGYVVFFPLLLLLFYFDYIPGHLILLFYALLITEHLGMELFRVLIVLEKTVLANFLFLFRTSLWVFLVLPYWYFNTSLNLTLEDILKPWLVAGVLSTGWGVAYLANKYKKSELVIEKQWIRAGINVGAKFLVGTMAFKLIEFSDRYIVDELLGRGVVGVYTFYTQLSQVLSTVLFTVVISMLYPKLIKSIYDEDGILFGEVKRKMLREILFFSGVALVGAFFLLTPILELMGKSMFVAEKGVFYFLLFSTILLNLSFIYHFVLIGFHKDNLLMYLSVAVAIINVLLNILFIHMYGIYGAGISKLVSFGLLYALKYKYAYGLSKIPLTKAS